MARETWQVLAAVFVLALGVAGARAQSDVDERALAQSASAKPTEIAARNATCPHGTVDKRGYCVDGEHAKAPLESARESCKESGGYWTGETCKNSTRARPIKCEPGYSWSQDAGACQRDGRPRNKQAQPQPLLRSPQQQIQNVIQSIQNLKHKCGPAQFWSAREKACIEND